MSEMNLEKKVKRAVITGLLLTSALQFGSTYYFTKYKRQQYNFDITMFAPEGASGNIMNEYYLDYLEKMLKEEYMKWNQN